MNEEEYLSALEKAKDLFLEKCNAVKKLKEENEKIATKYRQLETVKNDLLIENERLLERSKKAVENLDKATEEIKRLTEKLRTTKRFVKFYLTEQLKRMKEIEMKGKYNLDSFSYLVGDIGMSFCDAIMNESNNNHNETCNKQTFRKLTCDKETKLLYNNNADVDKTTFEGMKNNSNDEWDKITIENQTTFNKNLETKTSKTPKDPDVTFYDPLSSPSQSNTQREPYKKTSGQRTLTKNEIVSHNQNTSSISNLSLNISSPIGPPSKTSTPQHCLISPLNSPPSSPSILRQLDNEGTECKLSTSSPDHLSQQTHSPSTNFTNVISTATHCMTKADVVPLMSSDERIAKRKRNDSLFGSLLTSCHLETSTNETGNSKSIESKTKQLKMEVTENRPIVNSSLEVIVVDEIDFLEPTDVTEKASICSATEKKTSFNSSSLLFPSPQPNPSPVATIDICNEDDEERNEITEPKIALNFNLGLSENVETNALKSGSNANVAQFKHKEVVRGKDKRAKLNGYFCEDCEKYYGSLKLSESEMQERLNACSRHRARFSPGPSTPEHFWDVDFMNTHEYVERGFMRTGADLPPEKRQLNSRRLKLGKQH
ncbi:DNA endonuclease RBBP8-like [Xenia sp. Carnegie-2017]|uniref:DNA endonuclease RBBP8-like n=1 Tax=Xenia sp. Carnegie-2017 TaxID=2897299 RepID=UPI001F035AFF|nr:DNA endonuclease RBBP8-like [Xenia sp. Carnegie-2017]